MFRITKNPKLGELVGSVDSLLSFANQHGPGQYEIYEFPLDPFPDTEEADNFWGRIVHHDDGRIVTHRRPPDPAERIRRAAYHEAGHAVRFLEIGRSVERIEITSDSEEDGGTTFVTESLRKAVSGSQPTASEMKDIFEDLECLAAGSASEMLAFPSPPPETISISSGDVAQMMDILDGLLLGRPALDDIIVQAFVRAKESLGRPQTWVQVQALAEALTKCSILNGPEVEGVCSMARTSQSSEW